MTANGFYGYYDGVPQEYLNKSIEELDREFEEEKARCLAMAKEAKLKKKNMK